MVVAIFLQSVVLSKRCDSRDAKDATNSEKCMVVITVHILGILNTSGSSSVWTVNKSTSPI